MWEMILADMVFKGDLFRIPGAAYALTAIEEPTIYPVKKEVSIPARKKNGQHETLRMRVGSMVEIWSEKR